MKLYTTVLFLLALSIAALPARAGQGPPGSELREVRGSTVDKDKKPIASAVIYLQNVQTLTVITHISDDHGQYRFSGLDPNLNYELHAEHNDQTSSEHTISTFNRRKDMVVILKIDKNKKRRTTSKRFRKVPLDDSLQAEAELNPFSVCRITGHRLFPAAPALKMQQEEARIACLSTARAPVFPAVPAQAGC